MPAQLAATPTTTENLHRIAAVQVRLGTAAEDNTHGDHRNSALTTVPLPLTDDGGALARSLWFATNRGYAKALDSYMKVKTEQQVRAKEEDGSPDFSSETPATRLLPSPPPLVVDRTAWQDRIRELSSIFKQYPDAFFNNVALDASTETDYFVSSAGANAAPPHHAPPPPTAPPTHTPPSTPTPPPPPPPPAHPPPPPPPHPPPPPPPPPTPTPAAPPPRPPPPPPPPPPTPPPRPLPPPPLPALPPLTTTLPPPQSQHRPPTP